MGRERVPDYTSRPGDTVAVALLVIFFAVSLLYLFFGRTPDSQDGSSGLTSAPSGLDSSRVINPEEHNELESLSEEIALEEYTELKDLSDEIWVLRKELRFVDQRLKELSSDGDVLLSKAERNERKACKQEFSDKEGKHSQKINRYNRKMRGSGWRYSKSNQLPEGVNEPLQPRFLEYVIYRDRGCD